MSGLDNEPCKVAFAFFKTLLNRPSQCRSLMKFSNRDVANRNRSVFPNAGALLKALFLATYELTKKMFDAA